MTGGEKTEEQFAREQAHRLALEVLELLNRPSQRLEVVDRILRRIKQHTGLDAVGIRLHEGEDFPYFCANGFPEDFLRTERYLCAHDDTGAVLRDPDGLPRLECMCGLVLRAQTHPSLPFFTEGGSFWTNSTTDLLATTTEKDRGTRTRNRCHDEGYESVALIPLRSDDEVVGLLHLVSKQRGRFTLEAIRFFEGLGASIGIALQRQRVQQALAASEANYRELVENANSIILKIDTQGNITFFNEFAQRFFGYAEEEILGQNAVGTIVPATDTAGRDLGALIADLCQHPDRYGYNENENIRRNGERVWVAWTNKAIRDAGGRVAGILCVGTDLTTRKRAEQQIAALARFPEENPFPVLRIRTTGHLLYANAAARQLLGPLVCPDGARVPSPWQDMVAQAVREDARHEAEVTHGDRIVSFLVTPAAGTDYVNLYGRDVTERVQAERQRDALLRLNQAVLGAMPSALLVLDGSLRILMANPQCGQPLALAGQSLVGRLLTEVLPAPLLSHPYLLERVQAVADAGGEDELLGLKVAVGPGHARYFNVHIRRILTSPQEHVEGRPRILLILDDVTERKQLEDHADRASRLESLGTLAGEIAHDFNNTLAALTLQAGFLRAGLPEAHPLRREVEEMTEVIEKGAALPRQILAFSRKQALAPKVLHLNDLIQGNLSMLQRVLGEDIQLEFSRAPDLGPVRADPGQIEQVLMNLVVNARDAMPHGGHLTLETANLVLPPSAAEKELGVPPGPYVTFTVTDTGCGMDEATMEHIFEPFFTTKNKGESTGLGLSTVYGIVKQHGGHIHVSSAPGQGATFRVALPRVDPEALPSAPLDLPASTPRNGETILLVEDQPKLREVMQRALEQLGYHVLAAASPSDAERLFDEHRLEIALLLSDVALPECTGPELYARLRARHPALKALFTSGHTHDPVSAGGAPSPDTDFLPKPFAPATLAATVRKILDR